ncbi:PREDICTED: protein NRT1/ PTR FAMILY 4.1-like [Nelumbo nucifera]|uniref:Protein NRT1/ PTR FAMILY 4.2-like n=2 Tax=Nelumbo nucifera TaxID=4432 RepID=A0A822XWD9_NELNU|nr:PREDICTED: protein NRT1/ PTR FAMILY 4.1-like [Nelumbo nucifera]DAD24063.1 TPA_asm: hypothetical protein HUJ06_025526 [Nelumbo nucifera]
MEIERDEFTDWRGRSIQSKKHGGTRGATFPCVVEVLENMVFISNASNFVTYFKSSMHYPIAQAANMVTNFMGTSFLFTIFGGFFSDAFFTRFWTFNLFGILELVGLIILTIQAHNTQLQPPTGRKPSSSQSAMLYTGLYAMAVGVGGVKASLPALGADQFDPSNKRLISSFFNWFFFSLCTGGLLAVTIMVWVQENIGWNWGFKISLMVFCLALCIFFVGCPFYRCKRPGGSPLTRFLKVLASTIRNRKASPQEKNQNEVDGRSHNKFRFLNKALVDNTISSAQVEEARTFLGLLPIFASTIMMNCCLAQLQTFSVQQGSIMNKKLSRGFEIPTPSLAVFPLTIMLVSIPLYERMASLFFKSSSPKGYELHPLRRIGTGLVLASGSMAVAAVVESMRRRAANRNVTLSVFWLVWQYLLLGFSDMLTLGGMLEFFYSEAPDRMRSMCTALSWCSTSMGYFLSSVLVSVANSVTQKFGAAWLGGNDLNHNRLDLFYTLLCVLNFLNFLNYMYWAKRY